MVSSQPLTVFKRIQSHKSGPRDFEHLRLAQELDSQHLGAVWCIRFSRCGQLVASAGQDTVIRVWALKNAYQHFRGERILRSIVFSMTLLLQT